jgi:hypothetical protein
MRRRRPFLFLGGPYSRLYGHQGEEPRRVTLEHYAHIVGDAERVASEKFSQRIGLNVDQLESDSELESTSAAKTG